MVYDHFFTVKLKVLNSPMKYLNNMVSGPQADVIVMQQIESSSSHAFCIAMTSNGGPMHGLHHSLATTKTT